MKRSEWQILNAIFGALLVVVPMTATVETGPEVHKAQAERSVWPRETLDGTIMTVDTSRRLVIVKGPDNVPYDMRVSRQTRILSGEQPLTLAGLASATNQKVSVRFTPERSGDIAQLIQIQK